METTVITHLSNVINIVPPTPIILPPDYWINDYHVDHVHDIVSETSSTSRPYLDDQYFSRGCRISDVTYGLSSDNDCGVTGAKEIGIFGGENILSIPMYDSNNELSEYNIKFIYKEDTESTTTIWKPYVALGLYNNDASIWTPYNISRSFNRANIRKVYIWGGVDSFPYFDAYNYMPHSVNWVLFCGITVIYEQYGNLIASHMGALFNIYELESSVTQQSHLDNNWYTRP